MVPVEGVGVSVLGGIVGRVPVWAVSVHADHVVTITYTTYLVLSNGTHGPGDGLVLPS